MMLPNRDQGWVDSYLQISSELKKRTTYLWRNKYNCTLKTIGVFGSVAYFPNEDVQMDVDNKELSILEEPIAPKKQLIPRKKKMTCKCKYESCNYMGPNIQTLGKHYISIHNELSKKGRAALKKKHKEKKFFMSKILSDVFQDIDAGDVEYKGELDESNPYKTKYFALLKAFNKLSSKLGSGE